MYVRTAGGICAGHARLLHAAPILHISARLGGGSRPLEIILSIKDVGERVRVFVLVEESGKTERCQYQHQELGSVARLGGLIREFVETPQDNGTDSDREDWTVWELKAEHNTGWRARSIGR